MNKNMKVISLFSGVGGMDLGFINAGFNVIWANDIDEHAVSTYKANIDDNIVNRDIREISEEDLPKSADVVIGGPPCQGFSIAGKIGRKFIDDERNYLFKEFARIISIIKPKYFVMENVARLYNHNKGLTRKEIIKTFQELTDAYGNKLDYKVDCRVLNAADYGAPQLRQRIIFIGTNHDVEISFPKPKYEKDNYFTIKNKIDDLPSLKSGQICDFIPNHEAMNHTKQMLEKMSYISDGGDRSEIPKDIRPKSGDVRKYIRYSSGRPSFCVTGDMRKIFHYCQNRALTVRELARIQTFPDKFEFKGPKISQQQQVGNAVPPVLAEAIANEILNIEERLRRRRIV